MDFTGTVLFGDLTTFTKAGKNRRLKMRHTYIVIIAIAIIMAGLSVAGCSGSPTVTPTPGAGTASTGPVTPATGGFTTLKSAIDFTKVKWFEYKITSNTTAEPLVMTMKNELSVPYGGVSNAEHTVIRMDSDTPQGKSLIDMDVYSNPADGKTLGGHMKMTAGGMTLFDQDVDAGSGKVNDQIGTYRSQNPVLTTGESTETLTYAGTETVKVPAGTFNCYKYLTRANDTDAQIWIDPSVPIPIKWVGVQKDKPVYTAELTGWA